MHIICKSLLFLGISKSFGFSCKILSNTLGESVATQHCYCSTAVTCRWHGGLHCQEKGCYWARANKETTVVRFENDLGESQVE